jgi:Na+/melibiose symporter-like transporter
MNYRLEDLAILLGGMFGAVAGRVLTVLIGLAIYFVVWGLPWEQLISKAGFTGRSYKILLGLFCVPPLLGALAVEKYGEHSDVSTLASGVFAFSLYAGLLFLAFAPWSVHRELRSLKAKLKQ